MILQSKAHLLLVIFVLHFLGCRSQQGFLTLSCGREDNFSSFDPLTGVSLTSDAAYIGDFGTGSYIWSTSSTYLRYFDEPKSCYRLPTTQASYYLLRGASAYGNYDLQDFPPTFRVSLDATLLHDVPASAVNLSQVVVYETLFKAPRSEVNYCLISVEGGSKPVISNLELRLVSSGYQFPYAILRTLKRLDCGNLKQSYRYPSDPSDFIWQVDVNTNFVRNMNISYNTQDIRIPHIVLTTAATAGNTLRYEFQTINRTANLYVLLYFVELVPSVKQGERVFHIYSNEKLIKWNFSIPETGARLDFEVPGGSVIRIDLTAADGSLQGPLLNALEIYEIVNPTAGTKGKHVDALLPLKNRYKQLKWSGDPCLPLNATWDGLVCKTDVFPPSVLELNLEFKSLDGKVPPSISQLDGLESLLLDGNMFSGPVPDLKTLSELQSLELENNNLNGPIPDYFADMPSLRILYLQSNNLSGTVPSRLLATKHLDFRYSGNQFLTVNPKRRWKRNLLKYFIAGIVAGFLMLMFSVIGGSVMFRQRDGKLRICVFSGQKGKRHVREFTVKEIGTITKNSKVLIGEGGFGSVYYGTLSDGQLVAVKIRSLGSNQGTREFHSELKLLSAISHENLVPLLGFCSQNEQQILVYPFMSNGSLEDRLYGEAASEKPLDWPTRLSIALDAARGISFLHQGETSIIHRDIKTSNILLDQTLRAKISDFGFSKYAPAEGDSGVSLEIRGTAGYLDPEYYSTQKLTVKSDVYSFGVVLLEIITGRESLCISRPRAEWSLVEWARPLVEDANVKAIVDPAIGSNYIPEAMWRVAEVALQSVHPEARCRPTMEDITRELEDAIIIQNNGSQIFGSSISMSPSVSAAFSHTPDPR